MSDLANLVLAGVRDKVVQDLKDENEKLSAKNAALSKSMLLQAPSFGRVEIKSRTRSLVVARTQQFPDSRPRCDCCSWYPMAMEHVFSIEDLPEIDLYLGLLPDHPLAHSKGECFRVKQVTGYSIETQCTALQIVDTKTSATLHIAIGPIQRDVAKTLFSNIPRDLKTFCQRFTEVSPGAIVEVVCMSIPNNKAIELLTVEARLSTEEVMAYLRIPNTESSNLVVEGDEAKDS